ncbi:MAG: type II toxin-antitoxin system HicA family toxin [Desulfotignum sp.]|nr:type II toxin-antitoxin system HicA family toxin [Desulfotignum sp.]
MAQTKPIADNCCLCVCVRQKGSHVRMRHTDGRVTSVPCHPGQDIGKGLAYEELTA